MRLSFNFSGSVILSEEIRIDIGSIIKITNYNNNNNNYNNNNNNNNNNNK